MLAVEEKICLFISNYSYICICTNHFMLLMGLNQRSIESRAGLRGGATGANIPGSPLQGGPRDEIYLLQINYTFEKFL